MKALIVDDVKKVAESLKQLIVEFCEDVDVIGIAEDAEVAKSMIEQYEPDLVFLDIQMPGKSGLDLLSEMDQIDFSVIFVTAFDQYAIKAIRFGAIDFLLKPVDIDELKEAIERAKVKSGNKEAEIKNMVRNILSPDDKSNTIIINSDKGYKLIKIAEIIRIESEGNYSTIFTEDGKRYVSSKNLKSFEQYLESYQFTRIHNSHLINNKKIKDVYTKGRLEVILDNGDVIPLSTRKKQVLIKLFYKM